MGLNLVNSSTICDTESTRQRLEKYAMDCENYLIAKVRLRETIVRGHDYVKTDAYSYSDCINSNVEDAEQSIRDDVMKQL